MTHERGDRGSWMAGVAAYGMWGAMPLFWRLFEGTPAFIVFLHRCVWSLPFLVLLSFVGARQSRDVLALDRGRLPWLIVSGLLIGANWWIYIYGVSQHQVVEMSLGYFLAPLLSASLGVILLGERLTYGQWVGVALVILGVIVYGANVGHVPILAMGLAVTFSGYSLVRKVVKASPLAALTTESLVLFLLAVFYLLTTANDPEMSLAWQKHSVLLVLGGTMTALPLLWFAHAVRGLSLTSLGMLNYISPTGKFIIAVVMFGEVVSTKELWSFVVLWLGILIYLFFTFQRGRIPLQPE
jgi:chloramphenicol-sensitive protein RarD